MDYELDACAVHYSHFEQAAGAVGANQQHQALGLENPDRVVVGVQHVFVADSVTAGAGQDRGIHDINLY